MVGNATCFNILVENNTTCDSFILLVCKIKESGPGARQHRFLNYDFQACNFSLLIKKFMYGLKH